MRLVHLADLHLGHPKYQRLTPGGLNQREADVAAAFARAIDRTIELNPEIVLIAGDVFDTARPSNPAILHSFNHFARLRQALPGAAIVMVAGDHDLPRVSEVGCILRLFARLGIEVAEREARSIVFERLGLQVMAVPNMRTGEMPLLLPREEFAHRVLVMHAEIDGVVPRDLMAYERPIVTIPLTDLHAAAWSYIALGHYHVHREIAPNAYYAGSLDHVGANVWLEKREEAATGLPGKGIVEYDLETRRRTFHPIAPARRHVDLPAIDGRGRTAAEIDDLIRLRIEQAGEIDGAVIRLVIREIPRHIARDLDPKPIREVRRRALHFHLDTRKPDVVRFSGAGAPAGRRPSLIETVTDRLQSRPLSPGIERNALIDLAVHYLREVERREGTPAVSIGEETG